MVQFTWILKFVSQFLAVASVHSILMYITENFAEFTRTDFVLIFLFKFR